MTAQSPITTPFLIVLGMYLIVLPERVSLWTARLIKLSIRLIGTMVEFQVSFPLVCHILQDVCAKVNQ